MITSGLRVFDIRDPYAPKEIAYFVAPPSTVSETGSPVIDERANWAMSQPAFVPERGEIWYSDGTSGFYALRMAGSVWPFPQGAGASGGCVENSGLTNVAARPARRGVRIGFTRQVNLPVRVDVFRVSSGRRVLGERRVGRFRNRVRSFTFRPPGPGVYFARLRMVRVGRPFDTHRIVFERLRSGRVVARTGHHRRDGCGLLRAFKLERPVFGGRSRTPLRAAYRLSSPARVTVTVLRGRKVVKRFRPAARPAGRTFRLSLPARGLRRGPYRVRLHAAGGEDQISATLAARRL
jgi:hypothetical protein